MADWTCTNTSDGESKLFGLDDKVPVVLIAHTPPGSCAEDRYLVGSSLTVGRSSGVELTVRDDKMSKKHLKITHNQDGCFIEDLGSTNGTFVDGSPASKTRRPVEDGAVIRAGRTVLVFHEHGETLLDRPPKNQFGVAGGFHTAPLLRELREAALSKRHILLTGPSGSGKESASGAIAEMGGTAEKTLPLVAYNAAGFASSEEATTTLLGVGAKVFSGVDARAGLVEKANGGVLFLDEVHNLPERVQRSLLRIIENGKVTRVGETNERPVDVRFVFASNVPGPDHGLAHDLLARLRLVGIPALGDRRADVPAIFKDVLERALGHHGVGKDEVIPILSGDHYETLMLDGFKENNVRGLIDLADRIATRIEAGTEPKKAVTSIFTEQFSSGPVAARQSGAPPSSENSHYDIHKKEIVAAYTECDGNLSATERLLQSQGIKCSRRWLRTYLKRWGLAD